jgi:hypothetical protein
MGHKQPRRLPVQRGPLAITDAAGDAGRTCAAVDALAVSRPWLSPAARHRAGGLDRIDRPWRKPRRSTRYLQRRTRSPEFGRQAARPLKPSI